MTLTHRLGHINKRFEVAPYEPPDQSAQERHGGEPRQQGARRHTGRHRLTHVQRLGNLNDVVVVSWQRVYPPGNMRRRQRGQTRRRLPERWYPWVRVVQV